MRRALGGEFVLEGIAMAQELIGASILVNLLSYCHAGTHRAPVGRRATNTSSRIGIGRVVARPAGCKRNVVFQPEQVSACMHVCQPLAGWPLQISGSGRPGSLTTGGCRGCVINDIGCCIVAGLTPQD